jgi:5-methylcytosine-specific restriction protein A
MPVRAASACARPGCRGLVRSGICSVCGPLRKASQAQHDALRGTPSERGYDWQWVQTRRLKLLAHPLCERCESEGRVSMAQDVHHIKPIRTAPDLRLDLSNLLSVCRSCHAMLEKEVRDEEAAK